MAFIVTKTYTPFNIIVRYLQIILAFVSLAMSIILLCGYDSDLKKNSATLWLAAALSLVGGILGLLQRESMKRLTSAVDLTLVTVTFSAGIVSANRTSCKHLRSLFKR